MFKDMKLQQVIVFQSFVCSSFCFLFQGRCFNFFPAQISSDCALSMPHPFPLCISASLTLFLLSAAYHHLQLPSPPSFLFPALLFKSQLLFPAHPVPSFANKYSGVA